MVCRLDGTFLSRWCRRRYFVQHAQTLPAAAPPISVHMTYQFVSCASIQCHPDLRAYGMPCFALVRELGILTEVPHRCRPRLFRIAAGNVLCWQSACGSAARQAASPRFLRQSRNPCSGLCLICAQAEGKSFSFGKRQRLRQAGLWFVDDDSYFNGRHATPPSCWWEPTVGSRTLGCFSIARLQTSTASLQRRACALPECVCAAPGM